MTKTCICGRQRPFDHCCGRFLTGAQTAKTPEQLMRSRYAAYALGGHGKYLLATWFAATAPPITATALSEQRVNWVKLEVLASDQLGDQASVAFKAYYRQPGDATLQIMHETSVFQRTAGRWFYVGGEVNHTSDSAPSASAQNTTER